VLRDVVVDLRRRLVGQRLDEVIDRLDTVDPARKP
jgi:hypothetical protein